MSMTQESQSRAFKGESPIYPQSAWDEGYSSLQFAKVSPDDASLHWLLHWAKSASGDCFEVGCFPGRYLAALGDLGFRLNGIDSTPRTKTEMKSWLEKQGYSVGQVMQGDFFELPDSRSYDLVYSVGFIEHFPNWAEAIRKHAELVKPGGLLLITVPNFAGALQKTLHQWLDPVNLSRHHLPAMDPELWKAELAQQGFEILESSYFPEFDFWIGEQKRNLIQKAAFFGLRTAMPLLKRALPRNRRFCAPYCGIVAQRRKQNA